MQNRFSATLLLIIVLIMMESRIYGEAFGNSAISIPKVGMVFFDTSPPLNEKPWGIGHQWTLGTTFMQALSYRWFWVVETHVGLGKLSEPRDQYVAAFYGGAGLRFNIFDDDFRPHLGTMVHYLHFLGDGARAVPLDLGWPIFVGLKQYVGLEWTFYSELALIIEGGYGMYVNINEPFRQILYASAAFAMYF